MGYMAGDEFISFNGEEVTPVNFQQIVENYRNKVNAGDKVKAVVARTVKGKEKKVKLKAEARTVSVNVG